MEKQEFIEAMLSLGGEHHSLSESQDYEQMGECIKKANKLYDDHFSSVLNISLSSEIEYKEKFKQAIDVHLVINSPLVMAIANMSIH